MTRTLFFLGLSNSLIISFIETGVKPAIVGTKYENCKFDFNFLEMKFYLGQKLVGEFKGGKPWNGIAYYKNGNILFKVVNGKQIKP